MIFEEWTSEEWTSSVIVRDGATSCENPCLHHFMIAGSSFHFSFDHFLLQWNFACDCDCYEFTMFRN